MHLTSQKSNKVRSHNFVHNAYVIISTTMHDKFQTKLHKMIILFFSQIGMDDTQHACTHT